MEEKKDMLDATLERLAKQLESDELTEDERNALIEKFDKLYKTKIDRDVAVKKIEAEQATNKERLEFDKDTEKRHRKIDWMNLGFRAFSTVGGIGLGIYSVFKGYQFEEEGRQTSTTFRDVRNFISHAIEKMIGK